MMRKILYALILGSLFFAPLNRIEIANLEPIQAVWMYQTDGKLVLETDTKDKGSGATVEEALTDMKNSSPGIIYLDTAQYLLVAEGTEHQIAALQPHVKDTIYLCLWDGQGSLADGVKYADAHNVGVKLNKWKSNSKLPSLPGFYTEETRMEEEEK